MASITTQLMTVEEFRQLPEAGPFYYELRHGEAIKVTRPKFKHWDLQDRLVAMLRGPASKTGRIGMEIAFRALPEYELRIADVAYLSRDRWKQVDRNDNIRGAPELVIEILSPSNTVVEMFDKEKLCLENGCLEFWVIDEDRRQVKVSTPDGVTVTYHAGQEIPLRLFGEGTLKVDAIFETQE